MEIISTKQNFNKKRAYGRIPDLTIPGKYSIKQMMDAHRIALKESISSFPFANQTKIIKSEAKI